MNGKTMWNHFEHSLKGSEPYSRRFNMLMKPETHKRLKEMANAAGTSANHLANEIIERYIESLV